MSEPQAITDLIPIDEQFEGTVSWFYLDTAGCVTIGCGKMVPSALAATAIPMMCSDGTAATASQIEADWTRVNGMAAGHMPSYYRIDDSLRVTAATIASLLDTAEEDFYGYLVKQWPALPTYPLPAQEAILDMEYQLGPGALLRWVQLCADINAQDWAKAAVDCVSSHISDVRNSWRRAQFLAAANT